MASAGPNLNASQVWQPCTDAELTDVCVCMSNCTAWGQDLGLSWHGVRGPPTVVGPRQAGRCVCELGRVAAARMQTCVAAALRCMLHAPRALHDAPYRTCCRLQFYITVRDEITSLDEKHTVFGQVSEGLDTLDKIGEAFVDDSYRPLQNIR